MPEYRDIDHLLRDAEPADVRSHEQNESIPEFQRPGDNVVIDDTVSVLHADTEYPNIKIKVKGTTPSGRLKGKVAAGIHPVDGVEVVDEARKILEDEHVKFSTDKVILVM